MSNTVGPPISILQLSEYFMAAKENRRPAFVPSKIRIHNEVRGDMIFAATRVAPGIHECTCNGWGAISVKAENGKMLGIKWDECEIVEFTANTTVDPRPTGKGENQ